jgi:hypothetical protein
VSELTLEVQGPEGLFAILTEDEGAGYFYVYKPETQTVLAQILIYESGHEFAVNQKDAQIMWSADNKKCGVIIWGTMRGIIDLSDGREICAPLQGRMSPPISDAEWLKGFDSYMDEEQFIRARQRYWKKYIQQQQPGVQPNPEGQTPIETNFIREAKGPSSLFGVFEDEGATGYLYLYDSAEQDILRHLHIYDASEKLSIAPEDVTVMWDGQGEKCGVAIWGKMRGIIDFRKGTEGRVWLQDRETPGIGDTNWLCGFTEFV